MKNKIAILTIALLLGTSIALQAQEKGSRNIAGFGVNMVPSMGNGLYFGDPFDFFPTNEMSVFPRIFYARQLNESLRLGCYIETGKNKFSEKDSDEIHSFNRSLVGIDWLAKYPATKLHMQLGGYFGAGMIKADNWDNLKGIDFGLLAGPAFESGPIGIAVQLKAGFAPFYSDGSPEVVLMYTPGVLFKIYGRF